MSRAAAAFIALLALAPAFAQEARIITFDDALGIALEQNADLRQARLAVEASDVAVDRARGEFLPDLSLSTRAGRNFGRNFDQSEGRIIDTTTSNVNLNVSSGVTLFDGFANIASLRGTRFEADASRLDLRRTGETVVFSVAANFLALVQQQEQLRVQRENLTAESALERQIASYVDAGARTIADLYQQQASVASARLAVVEAERAALLAEVDLIETLQLDPAGAYQFEPPPGDLPVANEQAALASMLAVAYEQRADLEADERRVESAEQAVRVARSSRWPTVSLSTGYGSSYTNQSDFDLLDQFDQRRGGSLTLGFTLPLFDRGATSAATRRAELDVESARLALETRRKEVGLDVRRAELSFRAAREQLEAAEAGIKAAQLALEAAQDRYEAGAATLVELSQARAAHVQAAGALVNARSNLLFQRTLVDYATGALTVRTEGAVP
jgi:outer membrane protein